MDMNVFLGLARYTSQDIIMETERIITVNVCALRAMGCVRSYEGSGRTSLDVHIHHILLI